MKKDGIVANPFTKEDIKFVIENWEGMATPAIAEKLNRPVGSIAYLVNKIRKVGYDMPRKTTSNLKATVEEVLGELGIKIKRK